MLLTALMAGLNVLDRFETFITGSNLPFSSNASAVGFFCFSGEIVACHVTSCFYDVIVSKKDISAQVVYI
jgi:hypothetical protein